MGKAKSTDETLQKAFQLHQSGDLDQAERLYDAVLKKHPGNGDALNLKAIIVQARGRHDEAIALFERACKAVPNFADVPFNMANSLKALGRNDEALAAYDKTLQLNPGYAGARLNAGTLLQKLGRASEAIASFREMTKIAPTDPRGHYNLALAITEALDDTKNDDQRSAMITEAEQAFARAQTLNPNDANIPFAFANLRSKQGDHTNAIELTKTALKLNPNWPEALSNLGEYLRSSENYDEAVDALRKAATLHPDDAAIRYNLATALSDSKNYDEAERLFLDLINENNIFTQALVNLGVVYRKTHRDEKALALFEESLGLDPTLDKAYWNIGEIFSGRGWANAALMLCDKALALNNSNPAAVLYRGAIALSLGRFNEGWQQYQRRFDAPDEKLSSRSIPPIVWGGEDLSGKSIIVWTEQGLGDEVLHASILHEVIARADRCIVECSERMVPVFARSFPSAEVVGCKAPDSPVTPPEGIDYQIPIGSLGLHFRPDFARFPKHEGYLRADPAKVNDLRRRYEDMAGGRRIVGLSWRSKNERIGEAKSTGLSGFAPIFQTPGVMFVNLQYGECSEELAEVRERFGVEVVQDQTVDPIKDMDAFFAQVAAMDLVLSTSNTTAHVAGAQNIPVWVLLPHGKGVIWYWFLRRSDSPWYPSARLIRTDHKLDEGQARWLDLAKRTADDLAHWAQGT